MTSICSQRFLWFLYVFDILLYMILYFLYVFLPCLSLVTYSPDIFFPASLLWPQEDFNMIATECQVAADASNLLLQKIHQRVSSL